METVVAIENISVAGKSATLSGFRVALCSPTNENPKARHAASLGIRSLSSYLRGYGATTKVLDAHCWGWSVERTVKELSDFNPNVVGIQLIFFRQVNGLRKILDLCEAQYPNLFEATWVVGGHVPTFSPREVLERFKEFDLVIRGEGEKSLVELCRILHADKIPEDWRRNVPNASFFDTKKFEKNGMSALIPKLDTLPFPIIEPEDRNISAPGSIMGSRGCYASCEFCSVPPFFKEAKGPLWRLRSADNILDEIEQMTTLHQITHISFLDDIFLGTDTRSQKRAQEISSGILQRKLKVLFSIECRSDSVQFDLFRNLKQAGLARVFLGLEAGSDNVLARYNKMSGLSENDHAIKILKELELDIGVGFIMFNPETTIEEFTENVHYLSRHDLLTYRAVSNKMQAYPGTPVHSRLKEDGRLFGDVLYPDYHFLDKSVELLYATLIKYVCSLEVIDVHLLKLEFQSAGCPRKRNALERYKRAFSNNLKLLLDELAGGTVAVKKSEADTLQTSVEKILSQWENGRYGLKT